MTTPQQATGMDIFARAVAVSMSFPCVGKARKLTDDQYEVGKQVQQTLQDLEDGNDPNAAVDKKRTSANKKLMESPEFTAVTSLQGAAQRYVYSRTLPSPFRKGILLIPKTLLEETDIRLEDYKRQLADLVDVFANRVEDIKAADRAALGSLYSEADYPTAADIRKKIGLKWSYVAFGVPDGLPSRIFSREQEKSRQKLTEAVDNMQQVLRAEMLKLVKAASDTLSGKKDGKPKGFKNTLVTNIKDFLAVFRDRNLTDDKELDRICEQVSQLLQGVDPQNLRDSSSLRNSMANSFDKIKEQLDSMTVARGSRVITFEEDEQ